MLRHFDSDTIILTYISFLVRPPTVAKDKMLEDYPSYYTQARQLMRSKRVDRIYCILFSRKE